jgi:hypothetical protein
MLMLRDIKRMKSYENDFEKKKIIKRAKTLIKRYKRLSNRFYILFTSYNFFLLFLFLLV